MRQARSNWLTYCPHPRQAQSAYWSGFSVCLFVLLLAVFTWALHRRVAQYESLQPLGNHVPAAKMCLTERNQMPLSSMAAVEAPDGAGTMVLFLAYVFASVRQGPNGMPAELAWRRKSSGSAHTHPNPCLNYFFFLPPPSPHFSA